MADSLFLSDNWERHMKLVCKQINIRGCVPDRAYRCCSLYPGEPWFEGSCVPRTRWLLPSFLSQPQDLLLRGVGWGAKSSCGEEKGKKSGRCLLVYIYCWEKWYFISYIHIPMLCALQKDNVNIHKLDLHPQSSDLSKLKGCWLLSSVTSPVR